MTLVEFAIDLSGKKDLNHENIVNVGNKIAEKYGQKRSRFRAIDLGGGWQVESNGIELGKLVSCMKIVVCTLCFSSIIGTFAIYDLIAFIQSGFAKSFIHPFISTFLILWAIGLLIIVFYYFHFAKKYSRELI